MEIDGGPSSASAALQSAYDALRAAAASLRESGSTQEGSRAGRGALLKLKAATRQAVAAMQGAKGDAEEGRAKLDAAALALQVRRGRRKNARNCERRAGPLLPRCLRTPPLPAFLLAHARCPSLSRRLPCAHTQNLLYEREHYSKEIAAADNFVGAHTEVEVLGDDEFERLAPPAAAASAGDAHARMLDRIAFERDERARLVKKLDSLKRRRAQLQKAQAARRKSAAELPQRLHALQSAAAALRSTMGVDAGVATPPAGVVRCELADLLPEPLYVVFRTFCSLAYTQPECGVAALVDGDEGSARQWRDAETRRAVVAEGADGPRKAARVEGEAPSPSASSQASRLCPLLVVVGLEGREGAAALELTFGYDAASGLATCRASAGPDARGDLLECLPLADGSGRPLQAPQTAHAHRWAQVLAGGKSLPWHPADIAEDAPGAREMVTASTLVRVLRARLRSRAALERALAMLGQGGSQVGMPAGVSMGKIEDRTRGGAEVGEAGAEAAHARELGCLLTAGDLRVEATVRVSPAYPERPPVWRLAARDAAAAASLPPVPAGVAEVIEEGAGAAAAGADANLAFELERAANVEAVEALPRDDAKARDGLFLAQALALGRALDRVAAAKRV